MSRDDLTSRLRATFVLELDEQVRALNAALLAMEQQPAAETIRVLFRSAHTVKGAARVAGVPIVEDACHTLEAIFADVRDTARQLSGSDFALLFAVIDGLADVGQRLRGGDTLDDSPLAALLPRLRAAAGTPASPGAGDAEHRAGPVAQRPPPQMPEPSARLEPSPPEAAAVSAEPETVSREPDELVRVSAERLDALVSAVGELLIATGRATAQAAPDDARRLDRATDVVVEIVHGLRLRPFSDACDALPRAVRDVATSAGRDVELEVRGGAVEADRVVVDALREPLLHLVRNAVDHGIEPPDERVQRGKPRTGRVTVTAALAGGRLVVTVADDGGGLNEDAVRAELKRRGVPVPRTPAELTDALLGGGFSTRREATAISGRGVGLDVVRAAVERIGGGVDVAWRAGRGTTFTIECPPSPMSLHVVMVRIGPHTFALPTVQVERLLRVRADALRRAEGRTILPTPQGPLPVFSLASLLGPPLEARPLEGAATIVVVAAGFRRAGFVVDDVDAEDEIVVRPLDAGAFLLPYAAGAAILPDGAVALVLNATALLASAHRAGTAIAPSVAPAREAPRRRVLVADDSITTRTLEQSVLEAAGYDVTTAVDGEDAWQRLLEVGADLIVADVEMPRMDGFALCRRVRASRDFAQLPIVLVTGLDSPEDRARGMEAGADAYIVKSAFDQAGLVDTVSQLVGR